MKLYIYTGAPDKSQACATTLADLALLVAALADPTETTNAATLARIDDSIPQIGLNDDEPIELHFYSDATTEETWPATAANSVVVSVGLRSDGNDALATAVADTVVSTYRTGTLPLTTARLKSWLSGWARRGYATIWLHIRRTAVTTGYRTTQVLMPITIADTVLTSATTAPSTTDTYYTAAESDARFQPLDAALTALAAGSDFVQFTGPATSTKVFTLPNASATILTDNAAVTVAQGGTGRATGTTAYALIAAGTTATGAQQTLAAGATTEILVGGGASALPVWTTATGSGAPVRATSPTLVTPVLGVASGESLALTANTASTSTTTGALTVVGGLGVGGAIYGGGIIISTGRTTANSGYVEAIIQSGDNVTLCGNDATNTYYLGVNYINYRGTETVPLGAGRASWRIGFDDTDSTGNMVIAKRSGGAAAGAFTSLVTVSQVGNATIVGGFGCNTKAAQTAYASGGALAAYGAGANGFDSGANASALHALVVNIRAALVANGIMS